MLTFAELLEQTTKAAIRFEVVDNKLRCHVPPGAMTAEIDAAIRGHKSALLDLYSRHYTSLTQPHFDMNLLAVLQQLRAANVTISPVGNQLRLQSPIPIDPALVASLRPFKPVILAAAQAQAESLQQLVKAPDAIDVPASFFQERLWLVEQLEQVSGIYNVKIVLPLGGFVVDANRVEQVCHQLVSRHPVLRTGFILRGEQLFQRVMPARAPALHHIRLSGQAHQDFRAELEQQITTFCQQPFALDAGDVVRFGLWQQDDSHAVLVIALHHVVTDAWSNEILAREFISLYRQYSGLAAAPLPDNVFDYRDYACWERQLASQTITPGARQYWLQQLADCPPLLVMPADRYRPQKRSFKGAVVGFAVPAELSRALEKFGQQQGATPFTVYLTLVQLLLALYSGQTDICINSPVANRANPALKNLVGPCLNSLIFRAKIDPGSSFSALLADNRKTVQDGFTHQAYPFQQVVADLQPARDASYEPISQVCLVMKLNQPADERPSVAVAADDSVSFDMKNMVENANFDLNFVFRQGAQGLQGWIHFSSDLFDRSRIAALARAFSQLCEAVLATPLTAVAALPWCAAADQAFLMAADWPVRSVAFADTPAAQQHQQQREFWQAQHAAQPLAFPADWHAGLRKQVQATPLQLVIAPDEIDQFIAVFALLLATYTHQHQFSIGLSVSNQRFAPLAINCQDGRHNEQQLADLTAGISCWRRQQLQLDAAGLAAVAADYTPGILLLADMAELQTCVVQQLLEQYLPLGLVFGFSAEGSMLWYDSARYQTYSMALLLQRLQHCWQQRHSAAFLQTDLCRFIRVEQAEPLLPVVVPAQADGSVLLQRLRQLAADPQQIAFRQGGQSISYARLERITDQLAQQLHQQLRIRHAIIAIEAVRDLHTMCAYVAILKAGCGVMPLVPDLPDQRLSMLLELAEPDLLLCRSDRFLALTHHVPVLSLTDLLTEDIAPAAYQAPVACLERPGYVLFTSGSTGTPKTVVVPQKTLDAYCQSWVAVSGLDKTDNQLQFNTLSFDLSIEEIFASLWAGATVVLYPTDKDISVGDFISVLQDYQITRLRLPTGYWHAICAGFDSHVRHAFAALKSVAIAGEPANPQAVQQWMQALPEVRLLNNYGPTETTITVSDGFIPATFARTEALPSRVSIGHNLPHASCYVCTADLQSKPVGMVGELFISGLCLASSYQGAPGLTAKAFLPNPFVSAAGVENRIYATGDLAIQRPDGSIEILGRVDSQIKFRGFRIEPHEIAAKMRQLGCVQAEILVVDIAEHNKMLCAFIVSAQAGTVIRQQLQAQLPEYMVPALVLNVERIPLNASGKVDQRVLKSLAIQSLSAEEGSGQPLSATAAILAGLWQQVLQLAPSIALSNFFTLGGNSLAAVKLSYLLNEHFTLQLTIRDIMRTPDFREQAALIEHHMQIRQVHRHTEPDLSQDELITESF